MGVRTTCDEQRDEAKEHASKALKIMSKIISEDDWGWSEWNEEYQNKMIEATQLLLSVRRLL